MGSAKPWGQVDLAPSLSTACHRHCGHMGPVTNKVTQAVDGKYSFHKVFHTRIALVVMLWSYWNKQEEKPCLAFLDSWVQCSVLPNMRTGIPRKARELHAGPVLSELAFPTHANQDGRAQSASSLQQLQVFTVHIQVFRRISAQEAMCSSVCPT